MKQFLALFMAAVLLLSLTACAQIVSPKQENEPPVETEPALEETPTEAPALESTEADFDGAIIADALQGVWMVPGVDSILTFYVFQDSGLETYVVNPGTGAGALLSGSFTVEQEKISYNFGNATGYSEYTYENEVLTVMDANGVALQKLTADDLAGYLLQEEAAANHSGVICLADLITGVFPDSEACADATAQKAAAEAAIEAEGQAALATLNTTYDKVQKLTWYQSKSEPQYIDICCFIYPYIGRMDDGTTWLRVKLNYTDAQTDAGWIFFNHVIFSVDGNNTTKYFSRSDIIRDNDTEVWETADFEPDADEVALLRSIANSTETIIRFEGDEYYYDHIVTAQEKQAILNVLTAYHYLSNYAE